MNLILPPLIENTNHSGTLINRSIRYRKSEDLIQHDSEDDKISLVTATSTRASIASSTQTELIFSVCGRNFENRVLHRQGGGRSFSYRKKRTYCDNGIFSAPAGVNPHHVTSTITRRHPPDGSRLVFVWPQKRKTRGKFLSILAPLMHGLLIGLLFMDAIHLWPGEFLPVSLPSTSPIPLPPVKYNVIEPRWFDNS